MTAKRENSLKYFRRIFGTMWKNHIPTFFRTWFSFQCPSSWPRTANISGVVQPLTFFLSFLAFSSSVASLASASSYRRIEFLGATVSQKKCGNTYFHFVFFRFQFFPFALLQKCVEQDDALEFEESVEVRVAVRRPLGSLDNEKLVQWKI